MHVYNYLVMTKKNYNIQRFLDGFTKQYCARTTHCYHVMTVFDHLYFHIQYCTYTELLILHACNTILIFYCKPKKLDIVVVELSKLDNFFYPTMLKQLMTVQIDLYQFIKYSWSVQTGLDYEVQCPKPLSVSDYHLYESYSKQLKRVRSEHIIYTILHV